MKEQDSERFTRSISALAASKGKEPSEAMLLGFWIGLEDLEISAVERAVSRALRESRFFPTPAELRELAGHVPAEVRAVKAADAVFRAARQIGSYESVFFNDPIANATVRAGWGNWKELCAVEQGRVEWARKEFERIYAALMRGGITEEQAKYLPGVVEGSNQQGGFQVLGELCVVDCGLPQPSESVMISGPRVMSLDEHLDGKAMQ